MLKRILYLVLLLLLVACADFEAVPENPSPPQNKPEATALPNLGEAPELNNEVWLNADHPLRLADLRGQVVLLEMWTFG